MIASPKIYRVTLPAEDIDGFLKDLEAAEWYAFDTGERVATDEGPDAEAVLLVEPPVRLVNAAHVHEAVAR